MSDGLAVIERRKRELRGAQRKLRSEARRLASDTMFSKAAETFLAQVKLPQDAVVAGYWPLTDEFDPRPLLELLASNGVRLALPVVAGDSGRLLFRAWRPGMALAQAGFGTFGPPASEPLLEPRVVIVPLLAYDRQGCRLGYGGGFYDRTLAILRREKKCELAIGLGFAAQRVQQVPVNQNDIRLDAVLTEQSLLWIGNKPPATVSTEQEFL